MLLITDQSVTQIGRAVGYAERRYFTKVFAKAEGLSPTEYRERHGKSPVGGKEDSN
ncbi:helix-turn-helix domain-containing protein [Paenibacillus koleovorans]|uniref:helix-turn-helix domain-containing protein n=1 Tax=Paenibacillus koleovorans TaxID=121608 RepID=UPI001580ED30|nr:helix-turn-helix domain-containing protein [Paenibacillus koleovorans]